jgi:hypothetical protein
VGSPLDLGVPARIGKIPLALGAVLSIAPIDPGDHSIDGIPRANRVGQERHKPSQAAEDLGQHGSVAGTFDEHEPTPLNKAFGFVGPVRNGHG